MQSRNVMELGGAAEDSSAVPFGVGWSGASVGQDNVNLCTTTDKIHDFLTNDPVLSV